MSTALWGAATRGALQEVQGLLDQGVEVNAKTIDGETPLYGAIGGGHGTQNCCWTMRRKSTSKRTGVTRFEGHTILRGVVCGSLMIKVRKTGVCGP